jgi:SAM-dependent methyltransferase
VTPGLFSSPLQSHQHSLQTLESLYEYDDFMSSVDTLVDMGCGEGLDLEWWATRSTRDDSKTPLNIRCTGIDVVERLPMALKHRNIVYQRQDFEKEPIHLHKKTFDVIWCHDSFQYVIDPFHTLNNWRNVLSPDGMMVLILPQSTNLEFNTQAFDQRDFCYHNWTLVSLIHVLAVSGFDCRNGYFLKNPEDPWLHAIIYRGQHQAFDPRSTSWYDLSMAGVLPESAVMGIKKHGYLRQRDLVLPWIDRNLRSYQRQ